MRFDLEMVSDLCEEVGLEVVRRSPDDVAICLEPGVVLMFLNAPKDDDCLIGFEGTQWHTHEGLMCSDRHGHYVELSYLDVVTGLADGTLLLCEQWLRGELAGRWLVHRDFVDEFRFLQDGEELRFRSVSKSRAANSGRPEGA